VRCKEPARSCLRDTECWWSISAVVTRHARAAVPAPNVSRHPSYCGSCWESCDLHWKDQISRCKSIKTSLQLLHVITCNYGIACCMLRVTVVHTVYFGGIMGFLDSKWTTVSTSFNLKMYFAANFPSFFKTLGVAIAKFSKTSCQLQQAQSANWTAPRSKSPYAGLRSEGCPLCQLASCQYDSFLHPKVVCHELSLLQFQSKLHWIRPCSRIRSEWYHQ